ncbi:MAG: NifU family protein [Candidatus Competibacteraceae bacterium]|nr:NifU family protein [Candidatus Competibacteraceae bacterium]
MNTPSPVFVYAESTPNPLTLKFVVNRGLLPDRSVEYLNVGEASDSPIAVTLFSHPFVSSLYITRNFITVTRHNEYEWVEIMPQIRESIRVFLESGESPFSRLPEKEEIVIENKQPLGETESKIIEILDEYIRPAVEQDGGEIAFKQFENGIVHLVLKGSCSGCPSSTFTLKAGIEQLLCKMVPGVQGVMAENG